MLLAITLYLAPRDVVVDAFNWSSQAHARVDQALIRARSENKLAFDSSKREFQMAYHRPNALSITWPAEGQNPSRTVFMMGSNVTVYEPDLKQYAVFARGERPVSEVVRDHLPDVDDLVLALANPADLEAFYGRLAKLRPWSLTSQNGECVFVHTKGKDRVEVALEAKTLHLKRFVAAKGQQQVRWSFGYDLQSKPGFSPPPSAFRVNELDPLLVEPTYADAAARRLCDRVFRAYDRPEALAFEIQESGQTTAVYYRRGMLRQRDATADVLYDGRLSKLVDFKDRRVLAGKTNQREFIEAVAETGTRLDPTVRYLLKGKNPFRALLGRRAKISIKGSMTIAGEACTILGALDPTAELSLIVRNRDARVLSVASMPKGSGASSSQRSFRYLSTAGIKTGEAFTVNTPPGFPTVDVRSVVRPVSAPPTTS